MHEGLDNKETKPKETNSRFLDSDCLGSDTYKLDEIVIKLFHCLHFLYFHLLVK